MGCTVTLDSMSDDYIRHLIKLAQDKNLIALMGWDTSFSTDDLDEFIQAVSEYSLPFSQPSQPIFMGIFLNHTELPIGYAVLKGMNTDLQSCEVGVAVLDREYRNKGVGRLALDCIVQYAFNELNIQMIGAAILLSNHLSVNMCKRVGFKVRETMYQSWPMPDGTLADMVWMELTQNKFDPKQIVV